MLTNEHVKALASLIVVYPDGAAYADEKTQAHRVFGELVESGHIEVVELEDLEDIEVLQAQRRVRHSKSTADREACGGRGVELRRLSYSRSPAASRERTSS